MLITAIGFILMGIVGFILTTNSIKAKDTTHTVQIDGKCIGIYNSEYKMFKPHYERERIARIEYKYNNNTYIINHAYSAKYIKYEYGESISILVNPDNPEDVTTPYSKRDISISLYCTIVSIFLIVFGFILLFI